MVECIITTNLKYFHCESFLLLVPFLSTTGKFFSLQIKIFKDKTYADLIIHDVLL